MQFDETNKVIIQSMNRCEAMAFIKFLYSEIARHYQDIVQAEKLISEVNDEFAILDEEIALERKLFKVENLNEAWHGNKSRS